LAALSAAVWLAASKAALLPASLALLAAVALHHRGLAGSVKQQMQVSTSVHGSATAQWPEAQVHAMVHHSTSLTDPLPGSICKQVSM